MTCSTLLATTVTARGREREKKMIKVDTQYCSIYPISITQYRDNMQYITNNYSNGQGQKEKKEKSRSLSYDYSFRL